MTLNIPMGKTMLDNLKLMTGLDPISNGKHNVKNDMLLTHEEVDPVLIDKVLADIRSTMLEGNLINYQLRFMSHDKDGDVKHITIGGDVKYMSLCDVELQTKSPAVSNQVYCRLMEGTWLGTNIDPTDEDTITWINDLGEVILSNTNL